MNAPKENRKEPSSEPPGNARAQQAAADQAEANKSQSAANQGSSEALGADNATQGGGSTGVGGNPSE